jgi:hypothetical protein
MRVLITNNTLDWRAGSELYVRDLATALLARGHTPIAYSTRLGEVASELRAATVPVVDNLDRLSVAPDIIHGHHHIETMTALLRFPNVPAISYCHGWMPWEEAPPRFPRILRYIAVDYTCLDRLLLEHAIPEEQTRVLLNFVDLDRFRPRSALPQAPGRALFFSNSVTEEHGVSVVRQACQRFGISLDVAGMLNGNPLSSPEFVLGEYDIVFGKARAALEALAVGAAVVLCDAAGAGPMVTTGEFDRLRRLNFGVRTLREPLQPETIAAQLERYNPADAAEVSRRIRSGAGREETIDEVVRLYVEVIAEYRAAGNANLIAEERAAAEYLRWLSPRLKERDELHLRIAGLHQQVFQLNSQIAAANAPGAPVTDTSSSEVVTETAPVDPMTDASSPEVATENAPVDPVTDADPGAPEHGLKSLHNPVKSRLLGPVLTRIKKVLAG